MKKILALLTFACLGAISMNAGNVISPTATYKFVQRDSSSLYLDIYEPADNLKTIDGKTKPSVIYIFGGGFMSGDKREKSVRPFFKSLVDNGYRVIAIDYRLGLKGLKGAGFKKNFVEKLRNSINMAVEDVIAATLFIIKNSRILGIDPDNLVLCGSSAGAITSLQAEWERCNGTELGKRLPEDFRYAGVISFSGAILSNRESINYAEPPCPTFLAHGTADAIVPFYQVKFFSLCMGGSQAIANTFKTKEYNYNFYRFPQRRHEIAASMEYMESEVLRFLSSNVVKKEKRIVDCEINDPSIPMPEWAQSDYKGIYNSDK